MMFSLFPYTTLFRSGIYNISYTFGWTPLQQYLIDYGKGKYQALNIAWDTKQEKWFALNPDEDIVHGDWLHWTGGAMNWNTMCADCHSTNLKQNYFPRSEEHTSELQSRGHLVCRLLLEKKKKKTRTQV